MEVTESTMRTPTLLALLLAACDGSSCAGSTSAIDMPQRAAPYDPARSNRPGGLPIFGFVRDVVVPERDLVPLRTRWRDDKLTVIAFLVGIVFALFGGIAPFLVAP